MQMPSFPVAAVQMNSQPDLDRNMEEAYRWIARAARAGATLTGLPEHFAFLGDEDERVRQADRISEVVEDLLPKWARELDAYLLGGGYPTRAEGGRVYNRAILVDPEGRTVARYDKLHLFDVELSERESYRESDRVVAGSDPPPVHEAEGLARIGLSICYDVRFPELYRGLAAQGAELLCVPSAFTRPTGRAHWETLLRARAIENSAYVIAPAQTGRHGTTRETYGHAMIVDPWGGILADAGTKPGVILGKIDMAKLRDIRTRLPALRHRVLT